MDEVNDPLLREIKTHATPSSGSPPFAPAAPDVIESVELALGFALPPLLRSCYLHVGNGGFGPGYGLIGLPGGYASDCGDLVETYRRFREGQGAEGGAWMDGLLPFCEWGCTIFSCVACLDPGQRVYVCEGGEVWPGGYDLRDFFEMWLKGVDILAQSTSRVEEAEIVNPFTGRKAKVRRRRWE